MNKPELIDLIAEASGISTRHADNALSSCIEHITNALARGEDVSLIGFGRFTVKARAARTGRNPQTGAVLTIPSKNAVSFQPGKRFKEAVNS